MSWKKVELIVLHCDQGMGNLIKIYTDVMGTQVLSHLALIDLGSDDSKWRYAGDAVDIVMEALDEMKKGGITPKIDLLVFSHQDYDHWSLMPDLREKIVAKYPGLKVGKLVTGGQRWTKRPLDELKAVQSAFHCASEVLTRCESDYETPGNLGSLMDIEGVIFRVLAANAPVTRSAPDLIRNGTSAVIVVECKANKFVLPGDATSNTLSFINDLLSAFVTNPVTTCFVLSAPHHGALRTLADNFDSRNPKLNFATTFADLMSAKVVAASAGYLSKHKHPYKRVLDLLAIKSLSLAELHDYVYYDDTIANWGIVNQTKFNVYTTIASLTNPPVRRSWPFFVHPNGVHGFEIVERGGPAERPPARLTALPSRLLTEQGMRQRVAATPDVAAVPGKPGSDPLAPRRVIVGT